MPRSPAPRRPVVPALAGALAAAYLLGRAVPALGHGGHLAVRTWGGLVLYGAGAGLCLARAAAAPGERRAWALFGAGIVAYGAGSLLGALSDRPADDPPPLAYAGWLAFYACAYPALLTMLRSRLRPFTLSLCLDGLLGGLALATVSAAVVPHDFAGMATAKIVAGLTYPCADLDLLCLLLWACAMTGRRSSVWRWLAAALALAAVGDVVLGLAVARDALHPLDPVTACFPLAMLLVGVAAWRPMGPPRALRTDTAAVLTVPAGCVAAVIGVLMFGDAGDPVIRGLAGCALVVAFLRGGLTYRQLRALDETRRYARGFEEATIGMALVGADLRWLRVNAALCALLRRPAGQLVGRSILEVAHPDDRAAIEAQQRAILAGAVSEPLERRFQRSDGTVIDLALTTALVDGADGELFSQLQDVTARRRVERHSLALAELSRSALAQHEPAALLEVVAETVRRAMPADACALAGAGTDSAAAGPPEHRGRVLAAPVRRRGGAQGTLVVRRGPDRPPFTRNEANFLEAAANVLGTALDRATVEEELRTQALEDPLTGLANRSYLAAHVEQAIAATDRGEHLALLLLDLDRFKVVNDTLGHGAGDELLCAVADRLRATLRRGDLAARLGGDEFVVVCSGSGGGPWEVAALARRLLEALAAPYVVDGRELHISASAGLVFVDDPEVTAESLLRDADVAMYRAKEHGGDRYEVFDARLRAGVLERLATESALRHAVERGELALHVQPVVDLHRDELAGFEALVRWNHPERGLVAPADFIGVAEETGLIVGIGGWVLAEAARALATLQERAGRPLRLSVNLSARQLSPGLVDEVRAALDAAGVAPSALTLEVTETLLVEGPGAVDVLAALRALGVSIAIDDFGTGWSSLGALQRYPVDVLKLDRSLVAPAAESASAAALARAVVEMAQALGLDVVAEGIENEAQLAAMQALGCPHGQGYVFAPPMPVDEALELVTRPAVAAAPTAPAAAEPAS